MKNTRISTGVSGLDEVLDGGLKPASSYLIVGGAGTGKTVLSLQFIHESARRKCSCLYVTFAEPEASLRKNAALFGWDLSGVSFVDFSKESSESGASGEYSVFSPAEVEGTPIFKRLYEALQTHQPERLVIDSVTYLRYLSTDEYQFRRHIQRLVNDLSERNCLSLLLFEPTELAKENALALTVDGVITLNNDVSPNRVVEIRTIEVNKMRGSCFMSGRHPLRITNQGMTVWPHRIEKLKKQSFERKLLSSGIPALDELIGGGIETGTCTLITGPTGVGKSTMADQFLVTAAAEGIKCAAYMFEEGTATVLDRCRSVSIPLENMMENGSLIIREINPLELYPDELLEMLRNDMERHGVQLLVLDSLRGYNVAMEEFGSLVAHMQNIVNFVRRNRSSVFLIYEQEKITGDLQLTDVGVSYLVDNVLLLRLAEDNGELVKVISCVKKRLGRFRPELREFKITSQGVEVGPKISHLRGLLNGVPEAGPN